MSSSLAINKQLSGLQGNILKTVLYYDVFNYPLTKQEIYQNHPAKIDNREFEQALDLLVNDGILIKNCDFYSVKKVTEEYIQQRITGNYKAGLMLLVAQQNSLFIAKFPFVSGVNISGSLSKNYYDERSDVDYFIITKPNRLWLCRTIFILYYKTLSKEKKKRFCLNYFISSADLNIHDKNPFVAKELAYLIPTVNKEVYHDLLSKNEWHKTYYLNKPENTFPDCASAQEPWYKKALEFLFLGKFGNWMDTMLLKMTLRHWQKKHNEISKEDFEIQFRSRKHVCKYHTHGHQNKILQLWDERIVNFEKEFQIKLRSSH